MEECSRKVSENVAKYNRSEDRQFTHNQDIKEIGRPLSVHEVVKGTHAQHRVANIGAEGILMKL